MRKGFLLFLFILIVLSVQLYARGAAQSQENQATQNNEWILCITDFDVSSLPSGKVNISDLVLRKMVERLTIINNRSRVSAEYAFYEENAWAHELSSAARALSQKMDERSRHIFMGEPNWRYRQNIARIDADIVRLRDALEKIENNAPLINREPEFSLTRGNLDFIFPSAPSAGDEIRFMSAQRADGLLVGSLVDFHGRYFLSIKLYTAYARDFIYRDNILFSHENLESAIEEISRRLLVVLSGNPPAAISVSAEPEETLILINRSFAGRGETDVLEFPGGTVIVTATAAEHESLSFETELIAGEHAIINISLNPIEYGNMDILGEYGSRIYHGALYVGDVPLSLRLPLNQKEFIELETQNMHTGSVVFQTPDLADFDRFVDIKTSAPIPAGRVDRERRGFYWAWGGMWITGIGTWIAYYTFSGIDTVQRSRGISDQQFYDTYRYSYYATIGAAVALGVVTVYGIYRFIRYLNTANSGAAPVVVPGRN